MNNKKPALNRLSSKIKPKKEKIQKAKSEGKRKAQATIKKTFPLPPQPENYKQINHIYDIGKLELVDYKGNITECDIYGSPKKKFLNDITGITTYKERLDKGFISEFKYNNNKSLYIPKTLNFEGSSMFPRPLSLPFVSQTENPGKLVNQVKKDGRATVNKNKKLFSLNKPLKDNSIIPSFICHKIGKNYPKERDYLIKLIDDYILEKKEEQKLGIDYMEKSRCIKALNHYKKKLKDNMTNELYNGKLITAPNQKDIMLKYDSIRKAIYNNGLKIYNTSSNVEGKKIINFEIYKKLYKINTVGNKKSLFKKPNLINNNIILNKNNSYNNIDRRKLSYSEENVNYKTLYTKKNEINTMRKTFSIFRKNNIHNSNKEKMKKKYNSEYLVNDEKFKKTITTEFDKNNDESLTINTFYINTDKFNLAYKNNINLYKPINLFTKNKNLFSTDNTYNIDKYNKTANTFYKTTKSKTSLKRFKQTNSTNSNIISYTEKDKEKDKDKDNCSYISEETKNENNSINKFKTGFNLISIRDIKKKVSKENTLLKGFVPNEVRNEKEFKVQKNKKKDTTLKHYIDELELIKKVNKIQVEKEKRMNMFRDNLLRKKIEGKIIFEFNQKK